MNIEITAYVDVQGDDEKANAEIQRIAQRFADVLAGRYGVVGDLDGASVIRSVVVIKNIPRAWAKLSEVDLVERMFKRGAAILVPSKGKKEKP